MYIKSRGVTTLIDVCSSFLLQLSEIWQILSFDVVFYYILLIRNEFKKLRTNRTEYRIIAYKINMVADLDKRLG